MITERDYMARGIGKAYAFFDCKASKESIEALLPDIRDAVETPGELELSLMEDFNLLKGDSEVLGMAREAKEAGVRYAMEANYPNATNLKTADELAAILNQAYQSDLYPQGGKFKRWIFYEDNGQYVERE